MFRYHRQWQQKDTWVTLNSWISFIIADTKYETKCNLKTNDESFTLDFYCLLHFILLIHELLTRSLAQSQKIVYLFILNNIDIEYFAWKVCVIFLKKQMPIGLKFCTDINTFWNVSKHFCGHCNSTEYEWQPMKASQHMFILRKKKKDSSQVFAVHVNTASVYKGHTHRDCLGVCLTNCETVCFLMQTMFKSVWLLVSPQGHPSRNNMCRDVHSTAFSIWLQSFMVTLQIGLFYIYI